MKNPRKRKEFSHLNDHDRDRMEALLREGHTQKTVAQILKVHPSTITRERKRNPTKRGIYDADRAHENAEEKRKNSKYKGMVIAENPRLKAFIIAELKALRSPDEIAGRMKYEGRSDCVSKNAIYKWLYSEDGKEYTKYLCTRRTRRRRRKGGNAKIRIPNRISIKLRPEDPLLIRSERDLFVSPYSSNSKHSGLLVVHPSIKFFSGRILSNKTSMIVTQAAKQIFESIPTDLCTTDNGSETVGHRETGVPTYFCDPHAPWQKPHVEGGIGLIRRWFLPKGTDLKYIPDQLFQEMLYVLNSKYRKSLGYRSAIEVGQERGMIGRVRKLSRKNVVAFRG